MRAQDGRTVKSLGRKGTQTRARLLAATRKLLETTSPFQLTVAAVARAATTAPATFYVYFNDMHDVFYALSLEAREAFADIIRVHPEWFTNRRNTLRDSREFVNEFNAVWDQHSHELQYRNLESDRGSGRFLDLRTDSALPFIDCLAEAIQRLNPATSRRDAYADAVVLYSSVERLAATRHQFPPDRPRLHPDLLSRAQARIMAAALLGRDTEMAESDA